MSRARDLAAFVSNADGDIKFDTDTLFIDSSANRVGIGTTTPSAPLHIEGADDALATIESTDRYSHVNLVDSLGASRVTNDSGNLRLRADNANSTASSYLTMEVDGTEAMRIDSSGNVGIGTSSPTTPLHVAGASGVSVLNLQRTDTNTSGGVGTLQFAASDNHVVSAIAAIGDGDNEGAHLSFRTTSAASSTNWFASTTEAMRIDSSGNLLVGTTSTSASVVGGRIFSGGRIVTSTTSEAHYFRRNSTDGSIVDFAKDGTTVGRIGVAGDLYIGTGDTGVRFNDNVDAIYPITTVTGASRDNAVDLGYSSIRFDDIYATNGTIQTSDRNEKQDIAELDEAEKRVATAAKGLIRKYRWIDAVQEKGDEARIHVGIIAQDLQAAFEAEGLDASRYAMFISSTWWEADEVIPAVEAQEAVYETQTDEEGNETQVLVSEAVEAQPERTVTNTYETQEEAPEGATERTRLGVRYPELLAFIIGAM